MGAWGYLILSFLLGLAAGSFFVFFRFRTRLNRHKQFIEDCLSSVSLMLASTARNGSARRRDFSTVRNHR